MPLFQHRRPLRGLIGLLLALSFTSRADAGRYLRACCRQQATLPAGQLVQARYTETVLELEHNAAPWQPTAYAGRGDFWWSAAAFVRADTLTAEGRPRPYYSATQWTPTTLLYRDYGDQDLLPLAPGRQQDELFRAARYAPGPLLAWFAQHRVAPLPDTSAGLARFRATLHQTVVTLSIRRADARLVRVTLLAPDELRGDVTTTYDYADYATLGRLAYPTRIEVRKYDGRLREEVRVRAARLVAAVPVLLAAPAGGPPRPAAEVPATVQVQALAPQLHLLALPHTNDQVLVAEFATFLVVAEAPLNSANGELIIREAQRLAPGKPIRYFVFGHHHPHYAGGLRAFVRLGATILHGPGDASYVRDLATAPHTLQPDSLQRHPTPLHAEEITDRKTIADGTLEMTIYCIGKQSEHTTDYLIYYFPQHKLLFEDDLAGVPSQGPARKASARQRGLYQAITERGLAVDTVVQSWPVRGGIKTIIPFHELTEAMSVGP